MKILCADTLLQWRKIDLGEVYNLCTVRVYTARSPDILEDEWTVHVSTSEISTEGYGNSDSENFEKIACKSESGKHAILEGEQVSCGHKARHMLLKHRHFGHRAVQLGEIKVEALACNESEVSSSGVMRVVATVLSLP